MYSEDRKAILITYPNQFALSEAKSLAESAGYSIIDVISQKNLTRSRFGVGKGKAEEIKERVSALKPDVIIFGNTCYHFMQDLGLDFKDGKNLEYQNKSIFYHNNRLFIDSCLPSFIGKPGEENFCKSIYEAVDTWVALW